MLEPPPVAAPPRAPTPIAVPQLAVPAGTTPSRDATTVWPVWQHVLFRFFFIYWLLQTKPWVWFSRIPGFDVVAGIDYSATDWAVQFANRSIFRFYDQLIPVNGSGDTSWAWTQFWLYLLVAAVGCAVWSTVDRARSYPRLGYALRTVVRYYVATFALSYGIIKIFALQMSFPTISQLNTPLGDLLPMRLSWLFIGYSTPYQVFSGVMETVAGLLLLHRRTVTLGLLAACGAFLNVVMINLSYDVPVKLFASHLLAASVFLLVLDGKRLLAFLALNQAAPPTDLWEPPSGPSWQRYTRLVTKGVLVWVILVIPVRSSWTRFTTLRQPSPAGPFRTGIYDVHRFVLNGDTLAPTVGDSIRWRDVIFDTHVQGSIGTTDTLFWQRYRRGYFRYRADTAARTVAVWKTSAALDSTYLFPMRYETPDSMTVRLWTRIRDDSVYVELVRTNRHFQLTERQFHWRSEYNR